MTIYCHVSTKKNYIIEKKSIMTKINAVSTGSGELWYKIFDCFAVKNIVVI